MMGFFWVISLRRQGICMLLRSPRPSNINGFHLKASRFSQLNGFHPVIPVWFVEILGWFLVSQFQKYLKIPNPLGVFLVLCWNLLKNNISWVKEAKKCWEKSGQTMGSCQIMVENGIENSDLRRSFCPDPLTSLDPILPLNQVFLLQFVSKKNQDLRRGQTATSTLEWR